MGAKTGIEWTDATWNPIRGCSRVSEGCRHCYAETVAGRFSGEGLPYNGLAVMQNGKPHWTGKIEFVEKHLLDPLKWRPVFLACDVCGVTRYQCLCEKFNHRPRRIFVNSMSDLFHENVTDEMRDKIFAVMALSPQHTFQVLTKRPAKMLEYITDPAVSYRIINAQLSLCPAAGVGYIDGIPRTEQPIMPNLWLGVSVENQKAADDRLDYLCALAEEGWKTMVSFEPLLSDVDPGPWWLSLGAKTWAIVGGESGDGARPMHPSWPRGLRDQCVAAGVPFFFKQHGEFISLADYDAFVHGFDAKKYRNDFTYRAGSPNSEELPVSAYRVGKHAAGAMLDGREWKQFPEGAR